MISLLNNIKNLTPTEIVMNPVQSPVYQALILFITSETEI
ncbi:Uncharacterized protein dnm_021540 [Desulfonema magnum]|uniref:Uncharacterized protein n=1 Tax=Desulfonema magnum TaxID=45655 RepID=A0A975BIW0_9BACT|nr:Uncharacterized protein dnm_021540 [Desulfonema magnum]